MKTEKIKIKYLNYSFLVLCIFDIISSLIVIDGVNIIEKNFYLAFYNSMAVSIFGIILFISAYLISKFMFFALTNVIYMFYKKREYIKIFYIVVQFIFIYAIINNIVLGFKYGFVF